MSLFELSPEELDQIARLGRASKAGDPAAAEQDWEDGDTVNRQRLLGGDSPEVQHAGGLNANIAHPAGELATLAKKLVAEQTGAVLETSKQRDAYGRALSRVVAPNGMDITREAVAAGLDSPTRDMESQQAAFTGIAREALGMGRSSQDVLNKAGEAVRSATYNPFAFEGFGTENGSPRDRQGTFSKALDRGGDQLAASYGGVKNYLGDQFGIKEWQEDGRRMAEYHGMQAELNPREVENFTDVDTWGKAFDYALETLGENGPGFVIDAVAGLAGGVTGGTTWGVIAARHAGTAAVGAAARAAARGVISKEVAKGITKGAAIGSGISAGAQSLGDMENRLDDVEEGAHGLAPLAAGAITGALSALPAHKLMGDVLDSMGVGKEVIEGATDAVMGKAARAKSAGKSVLGVVGMEGLTEMADAISQEAVFATATDTEWDPFTIETIDAGIRGVIGGGTVAAGGMAASHAVGHMLEYDAARRAAVDEERAGAGAEVEAFQKMFGMGGEDAITRAHGFEQRAARFTDSDGAPLKAEQVKAMVDSGVITENDLRDYLADNGVGESSLPLRESVGVYQAKQYMDRARSVADAIHAALDGDEAALDALVDSGAMAKRTVDEYKAKIAAGDTAPELLAARITTALSQLKKRGFEPETHSDGIINHLNKTLGANPKKNITDSMVRRKDIRDLLPGRDYMAGYSALLRENAPEPAETEPTMGAKPAPEATDEEKQKVLTRATTTARDAFATARESVKGHYFEPMFNALIDALDTVTNRESGDPVRHDTDTLRYAAQMLGVPRDKRESQEGEKLYDTVLRAVERRAGVEGARRAAPLSRAPKAILALLTKLGDEGVLAPNPKAEAVVTPSEPLDARESDAAEIQKDTQQTAPTAVLDDLDKADVDGDDPDDLHNDQKLDALSPTEQAEVAASYDARVANAHGVVRTLLNLNNAPGVKAAFDPKDLKPLLSELTAMSDHEREVLGKSYVPSNNAHTFKDIIAYNQAASVNTAAAGAAAKGSNQVVRLGKEVIAGISAALKEGNTFEAISLLEEAGALTPAEVVGGTSGGARTVALRVISDSLRKMRARSGKGKPSIAGGVLRIHATNSAGVIHDLPVSTVSLIEIAAQTLDGIRPNELHSLAKAEHSNFRNDLYKYLQAGLAMLTEASAPVAAAPRVAPDVAALTRTARDLVAARAEEQKQDAIARKTVKLRDTDAAKLARARRDAARGKVETLSASLAESGLNNAETLLGKLAQREEADTKLRGILDKMDEAGVDAWLGAPRVTIEASYQNNLVQLSIARGNVERAVQASLEQDVDGGTPVQYSFDPTQIKADTVIWPYGGEDGKFEAQAAKATADAGAKEQAAAARRAGEVKRMGKKPAGFIQDALAAQPQKEKAPELDADLAEPDSQFEPTDAVGKSAPLTYKLLANYAEGVRGKDRGAAEGMYGISRDAGIASDAAKYAAEQVLRETDLRGELRAARSEVRRLVDGAKRALAKAGIDLNKPDVTMMVEASLDQRQRELEAVAAQQQREVELAAKRVSRFAGKADAARQQMKNRVASDTVLKEMRLDLGVLRYELQDLLDAITKTDKAERERANKTNSRRRAVGVAVQEKTRGEYDVADVELVQPRDLRNGTPEQAAQVAQIRHKMATLEADINARESHHGDNSTLREAKQRAAEMASAQLALGETKKQLAKVAPARRGLAVVAPKAAAPDASRRSVKPQGSLDEVVDELAQLGDAERVRSVLQSQFDPLKAIIESPDSPEAAVWLDEHRDAERDDEDSDHFDHASAKKRSVFGDGETAEADAWHDPANLNRIEEPDTPDGLSWGDVTKPLNDGQLNHKAMTAENAAEVRAMVDGGEPAPESERKKSKENTKRAERLQAANWRAKLRKAVTVKNAVSGIGKLYRTHQTRLERIHQRLADALFRRSGDGDNQVSYARRARELREVHTAKFYAALQGFDRHERNAAWMDAMTGKPVTATGKSVQAVLKEFSAALRKANPNYKTDGVPVVLNHGEVARRRADFKSVIEKHITAIRKDDKSKFNAKRTDAETVESLMRAIVDNQGVAEHAFDPVRPTVLGGQGFNEILRAAVSDLRDAGFIDVDADTAARRLFASGGAYAAWAETFGATDSKGVFHPSALFDYYLNQVPVAHQAEVKQLVRQATGKVHFETNRLVHQANSVNFAIQAATVLLFSGVMSLAELGVPVARSRGVSQHYWRDIVRYTRASDRAELASLAETLGTVTPAVVQDMMGAVFSGDGMALGKVSQRISETMFKYNGQEFVTRMVRVLATHWGAGAIRGWASRADAMGDAHLARLGLTRADAADWMQNPDDFDSEAGQRVAAAIRRFVDESNSNPYAEQMPGWMSSPTFQIVASLKKFFYAYFDNMHRSLWRGIRDANSNGGTPLTVLAPLAMAAAVMVPMAALSELIKELVKGAGELMDIKYMRRQHDFGSFASAVFQNTGGLGPLQTAAQAAAMYEYGSKGGHDSVGGVSRALITTLGPGVDLALGMVSGEVVRKNPSRLIPVVNQLPWARQPINRSWRDLWDTN